MLAWSAKLQTGTGSSGALEDLDEVVMITYPEVEASTVETTNLACTNKVRTFTPGLIDNGKVNGEANYTAATYSKMFGIVGLSKSFKVYAPTSASQTASFSGHVTKLSQPFEDANSQAKFKFEIKIEGAVTLA